MNETLKEHLEVRQPSTHDACEMLHIPRAPGANNHNYAGNTYLVALHHIREQDAQIAALTARVEAMLESYKRQLSVRGSVQTSEVIADLEAVLNVKEKK